jgi:hypothetical protein
MTALVRRLLPVNQRGHYALWLLAASLLIPLGTTNLRGLHHLVSCTDEIDQTFSVTAINATQAIVTGSTSIVREPPEGDCAAVEMNMGVRPDGRGYVLVTMPVVNETDRPWSTSVILQLDGLQTSVPVGRIPAGATKTKVLRLRLTRDLQSITGTLLVGP